jgi:hypothetical protein
MEPARVAINSIANGSATSPDWVAATSIAATGAGKDSNLTIQGSNIEAGRAVQLLADNQVKLLAAQNTASQKSTNSNPEAPSTPHIGWQTGGKRSSGGHVVGHVFVPDVPVNRSPKK